MNDAIHGSPGSFHRGHELTPAVGPPRETLRDNLLELGHAQVVVFDFYRFAIARVEGRPMLDPAFGVNYLPDQVEDGMLRRHIRVIAPVIPRVL